MSDKPTTEDAGAIVAQRDPETTAFLGQVLEASIRFDQHISNQLMDSHIDNAIEWAQRFGDLYRLVRKHNRDLLVHEVLEDFAYEASSVQRSIEHLKSLRMDPRE